MCGRLDGTFLLEEQSGHRSSLPLLPTHHCHKPQAAEAASLGHHLLQSAHYGTRTAVGTEEPQGAPRRSGVRRQVPSLSGALRNFRPSQRHLPGQGDILDPDAVWVETWWPVRMEHVLGPAPCPGSHPAHLPPGWGCQGPHPRCHNGIPPPPVLWWVTGGQPDPWRPRAAP